MKKDYVSKRPGVLPTKWHQHAPFNALTPSNHPVGCAAVAIAQILGFYRSPQNFSWNGRSFNWNDLALPPTTGSAHAHLMSLVGAAVDMYYMSSGSWALPSNVVSGFRILGYNVRRANHNLFDLREEVFNRRRPVMMVGGSLQLPTPLGLINGHYWVCDGGIQDYDQITFYAEYINPHTHTYSTLGYASKSDPYTSITNFYEVYHMNWGWSNGNNNGYFLHHNMTNPTGYNFSRHRENFYVNP